MKAKYFCEKCGYKYDTAEEAKRCEDSHGEITEAHVMPGQVYDCRCIRPKAVYVKVCNSEGREAAACYEFRGVADKDFEKVKQSHEAFKYLNF